MGRPCWLSQKVCPLFSPIRSDVTFWSDSKHEFRKAFPTSTWEVCHRPLWLVDCFGLKCPDQGCGIKGLIPTSVIQGNLPLFMGGSSLGGQFCCIEVGSIFHSPGPHRMFDFGSGLLPELTGAQDLWMACLGFRHFPLLL